MVTAKVKMNHEWDVSQPNNEKVNINIKAMNVKKMKYKQNGKSLRKAQNQQQK